jgi:hypothetical protein
VVQWWWCRTQAVMPLRPLPLTIVVGGCHLLLTVKEKGPLALLLTEQFRERAGGLEWLGACGGGR